MTATGQDIGTDDDADGPYYAGNTLEITFDVTDSAGDPKDLTGATVEWSVVKRPGGTAVLDDSDTGVTATITDDVGGEITVTVDAGVTGDLRGVYRHQLQVEDAAGSEDTAAVGLFEVSPNVVA